MCPLKRFLVWLSIEICLWRTSQRSLKAVELTPAQYLSFSSSNCHLLTSQLILPTRPPPTYTLAYDLSQSFDTIYQNQHSSTLISIHSNCYFTDLQQNVLIFFQQIFRLLKVKTTSMQEEVFNKHLILRYLILCSVKV